ncbi:6512_t:CDS:1 [Entrophospora sp. SA101]|nr:13716_t:CDS:1 [Entrophospora sp. SA101]CAJ0631724.1 6974_t:CDS:1 [Entrophospora sp. SA101]CAJ0645015.1 6512_t:CDS:1 [Entrophospora sp. SA101]CAJ0826079.1 7815_t:CDS:1 [Entrophospora sp. SA101]CAJ0842483.1 12524_t:CDS:1 [Entrophospora sp. SA101]
MVRVRIKSDAPLFSAEDYSYIMECRNMGPKNKILDDLMDKYKTSSRRIYQIWRGEETKRVAWDQPIPQFYNENDLNQDSCETIMSKNTPHIKSQQEEVKIRNQSFISPEIVSNSHIDTYQNKASQREGVHASRKRRPKSKPTQISSPLISENIDHINSTESRSDISSAYISDVHESFRREVEGAEKILLKAGHKKPPTL